MKRVLTALAIAALAAWPLTAQAGIDNSDHDRGGKICQNCHVPHNANGAKLWYEVPSGVFTGTQTLCYSCHDGSVTSVGLGTAFSTTLEQHKGITANGSIGDCNGCHDVHNQNPNGTGRFLYADVVKSANNEYCSSCHDGSAPTPYAAANGLGDHTYGGTGTTNHYNSVTFTCNQCHTPHGAVVQTTNPGTLTKPILLANNEPAAFYGSFCISCHNGTAPAMAMPGTGGVAAADVFNYAEAVGNLSELKHPTTTAEVGGCDKCHDVHTSGGAGTNIPKLLLASNANGAYCLSCHSGGGGPTIGTSHVYDNTPGNVNMNNGLTPPLPWSDEINDDPADAIFAGNDYPTATADKITCESCHSAHRRGLAGPLLREANAANELCGSCHPANY